MSQQKNLDHQVLSRCQDALDVEDDLDPDEDDDESATDL